MNKVLTSCSYSTVMISFLHHVFVSDTTPFLLVLNELTSLEKIGFILNHTYHYNANNFIRFGSYVHLKRNKMTSMPLMIENPVRRPMVPPMRLSWASVLIFLSLSMSSKVAVSK